MIKCSFANLSFSGKTNLKSLNLTSLFKLTTTLASNFELFLNVNNLIVGSLKLTPPKSNFSWTMKTSGWTTLALIIRVNFFPPLIKIGTSATNSGFGSLWTMVTSTLFNLSVRNPTGSLKVKISGRGFWIWYAVTTRFVSFFKLKCFVFGTPVWTISKLIVSLGNS